MSGGATTGSPLWASCRAGGGDAATTLLRQARTVGLTPGRVGVGRQFTVVERTDWLLHWRDSFPGICFDRRLFWLYPREFREDNG